MATYRSEEMNIELITLKVYLQQAKVDARHADTVLQHWSYVFQLLKSRVQ